VAILDADKEGFLRSPRSLIQTIGRAARNANGEVIMYAEKVTAAMRHALDETERRRKLQREYNEQHGITPTSIHKPILEIAPGSPERDYMTVSKVKPGDTASAKDVSERIEMLREQMLEAAESLDFERAAQLRDELRGLQKSLGIETPETAAKGGAYAGGAGSRAYGGSAATTKKRNQTARSKRRMR
jgi:excinuclease ABC subunit B